MGVEVVEQLAVVVRGRAGSKAWRVVRAPALPTKPLASPPPRSAVLLEHYYPLYSIFSM